MMLGFALRHLFPADPSDGQLKSEDFARQLDVMSMRPQGNKRHQQDFPYARIYRFAGRHWLSV
jgi:hypothetical protein